jgi:hypothetical protein
MTTHDHNRPKCRNEMEEGFIADMTYGGIGASTWAEGEPEKISGLISEL